MSNPSLFLITAVATFLCVVTPTASNASISPEAIVNIAKQAECLYDSSYEKPSLLNIRKSVICKGINDKNTKNKSLVPVNIKIAIQISNNIEAKYLLYALDKIKRDSPVYKKNIGI